MPSLSYVEWKAKYAPHDSGKDYDLVAAWQAGITPNNNSHFPDTFKFPDHPRFSIESKYWRPGLPAGRWEGENYIPMSPLVAEQWVRKYGQNMAPPAYPGYVIGPLDQSQRKDNQK